MTNDLVQRVIDDVVRRDAATVDRDGAFPHRGVDALAETGVLRLTTAVDHGGAGGSLRDAAGIVEALAGACGSTAMVVLMHYAANAVVEAHGPASVRREVGQGHHLLTLAFSEAGSRSHFWAPQGTAEETAAGISLAASKSWVTSAAQADTYVWSSRPARADGPMSLWLVPASSPGLAVGSDFDGLGLRGNGSVPVTAQDVLVDPEAALGADGAGLDVALAAALPWFLVLSTAFSLGLIDAVVAETTGHLRSTRLAHLDQALVDQSGARADLARLTLLAGSVRAFLDDTLTALETGREDATLRVLQSKALAAEAAVDATDLALKAGGGAAFRKELGIERRFRDARAARVMAPTTDALLDFVGRAVSGLPLLGP